MAARSRRGRGAELAGLHLDLHREEQLARADERARYGHHAARVLAHARRDVLQPVALPDVGSKPRQPSPGR